MRLIDAEYLLYGMGMFSEKENGTEFMKGVDAVAKMIDDAPTIAQSGWIPCSERLPDAFDGEPKDAPWYLCSKKNGTRCILIYQKRGAVDNWRTITGLGISDSVIAYMPLPTPYNPDHIRDATKKVEHIVE